jgi:cobalt/nickel transport protein
MKPKDRNLIIVGVILCLAIAVISPFIASSDPDGLEKSADQVMPNPETESVIQSPMPDYTIEPLGKYGEIVALTIGILLTLGIAYVIAILLRKKNPPETSQ